MSARDVIDLVLFERGYTATEGTADAILSALSAAGWVVAKLPTAADQWDSPGYDRDTPANIIWVDGYNAALAAVRAAAVEVE